MLGRLRLQSVELGHLRRHHRRARAKVGVADRVRRNVGAVAERRAVIRHPCRLRCRDHAADPVAVALAFAQNPRFVHELAVEACGRAQHLGGPSFCVGRRE